MCTVLLPPGGNPIAVNKYINISPNRNLSLLLQQEFVPLDENMVQNAELLLTQNTAVTRLVFWGNVLSKQAYVVPCAILSHKTRFFLEQHARACVRVCKFCCKLGRNSRKYFKVMKVALLGEGRVVE